jgi:L-alanine-DL-glutamate epimerase-like enolase superfamily enzyme
MKVTSVERILVDTPFRAEPERNMARQLNSWHIVEVCRVTADNGLVGYGETLPSGSWNRVTDASVQWVKGQNPFDLMWDDSLGAGLQMALFDLAGKAAEVPIYRLLGEKVRDWCPISWWSIDMPPEDIAAEAKNAVTQGYTSYKLKVRPWFDLHEQVGAVCTAVPPNFHLIVNFDTFLNNTGSAIPVLKDLEKFININMLQSPIPEGDIIGYQRLRPQIRWPVAQHYGQSYSAPPMTALREDICDGFLVGGGANFVVRGAAVLREFNKPFWLQIVGTGITTAFVLHFGAVLSHARWPAVTCMNVYAHQLLREPLIVQGGYCRVPEAPGLGVAIDEDALQKFATSSTTKDNLRAVYAVVRPNGDRTYYAHVPQYMEDFLGGNQPVFERGVHLEVLPDDGSASWADLYRRVQAGPVWSPKEL